MAKRKAPAKRPAAKKAKRKSSAPVVEDGPKPELVIITGLSGSGKASVLKALEDIDYYAVDNLPVDLIPKFAELTRDSATFRSAALVVDIREGEGLKRFPQMYEKVQRSIPTRLLFLEADPETLMRRFSETRRPHPLGVDQSVATSIAAEMKALKPIRDLADLTINTSKFNVHELRDFIRAKFRGVRDESKIMVYVTSFGYRHGVPLDSDLVFDVRFLPNPNYIPKFKKLTGRHPGVARYIRSFPQTEEFMARISELLIYLLPHYIHEGKSYLTIGFGCTGGHHRSVMIADQIRKNLVVAGYPAKVSHRDMLKPV
jgi:RNase adapter protein RapZ